MMADVSINANNRLVSFGRRSVREKPRVEDISAGVDALGQSDGKSLGDGQMPWTGKSFAKHNKGLDKGQAKKAASVANAVLKDSGDEGKAIRIANWNAAGRPSRQMGGPVPAGQGTQVREEGPETFVPQPAPPRRAKPKAFAGKETPAEERLERKVTHKQAGNRIRNKMRTGAVSLKAANRRFGPGDGAATGVRGNKFAGHDQQPIDASSR